MHHRYKSNITQNDCDILADTTNGQCGILLILRGKNVNTIPDVSFYAKEEEGTTTGHVLTPMTVTEVVNSVSASLTTEERNKCILEKMNITSDQQKLLAQETKAQFNSPLWSSQRVGRITASKFKLVCNKVSDNFEVKNTDHCKSIISSVCGSSKPFSSKATTWGIRNEPKAKNFMLNNKQRNIKSFLLKTVVFLYVKPIHLLVLVLMDLLSVNAVVRAFLK